MGSSMDNRHMLLQATFLILFLTSVSAQCVYSETKCRCRKETSGNLCLRHTGDYICKAYECGEGYACDCKSHMNEKN